MFKWRLIIVFIASLCAIPIVEFIIGVHITTMVFHVSNVWWLISIVPIMLVTGVVTSITISIIAVICSFILAVTE